MSLITRDDQGAYHWTAKIDAGYEQKTFRIVFGVVGGICALFIIMSLTMGGDMMLPVLLSCAGALAVAGGVCWLFKRNAGNRNQSYIMTDSHIMFCMPRANNAFAFSSTRKAMVYTSRNMIELYQPMASGPIFVAHEDFGFVRDYILQRIPADARIEYV